MKNETKQKEPPCDMRIGERLYTFPSFNEGCKAIAINCRFIGNQNELEELMRKKELILNLAIYYNILDTTCKTSKDICRLCRV